MKLPHSQTDDTEFMTGWDKLRSENTLRMMQYLFDFDKTQFELLNKHPKEEQNNTSKLIDHAGSYQS